MTFPTQNQAYRRLDKKANLHNYFILVKLYHTSNNLRSFLKGNRLPVMTSRGSSSEDLSFSFSSSKEHLSFSFSSSSEHLSFLFSSSIEHLSFSFPILSYPK